MIINNMLISILILLFINNDINTLCFDEMSSSNILFCNPNPSWMRWRSLKSSFVGKFHIPRWSKILFQLFCINSRARVPATIVLNEYSQFCFWINILVLSLNWILNSFAAFLHKFQRKSKSASELAGDKAFTHNNNFESPSPDLGDIAKQISPFVRQELSLFGSKTANSIWKGLDTKTLTFHVFLINVP